MIEANVLIAKYVELRDRKAALEKTVREQTAQLDNLMNAIETRLTAFLDEQGVTSLKSPSGTVYFTHRESATVADWVAVLDYIRANEAWDLLEHRVSKTAVKALMEEDRNGEYQKPPPPGVDFRRFRTVGVRRG